MVVGGVQEAYRGGEAVVLRFFCLGSGISWSHSFSFAKYQYCTLKKLVVIS